MKIALVSQEYPPETARGGIGTQTYAKAHGLAGIGHQVFVISRSAKNTREEKKEGTLTIIRIPGMEAILPEMTETVQWITHSVVVAAELEALHQRIGLDIIDFPEWAAEGYTWLLNRTRWKTVPSVIQLHGPLVMLAHTLGWPDTHSSFYKTGTYMEASCIGLADGIYSSSDCSANWIRKFYEAQERDIPVIHTGIDTTIFVPGTAGIKETPIILFIGKLAQNKGIEELIDACTSLKHEMPGLKLKIAGNGSESYTSFLHTKATELKKAEMVEFSGYVSHKDLPLLLREASVLAVPSHYEGGPGFVYLEAMACGLPVIACSGSGAEEIIEQDVTGVLVPPKNTAALAAALKKILCNNSFAATIGANARNYIVNKCERQQCLQKLESFYTSVIRDFNPK